MRPPRCLAVAASRCACREAAAASCVALLASCSAPQADEYFPLAGGHQWTYRVTQERGDPPQTMTEMLTLRTRGADTVGGAPAWRRRSHTGMDYWLRSDASGIVRVASKTDVQSDPQLDEPPRVVLRRPFEVGTQWESTTMPYVLQRRNEFPQTQYQRHTTMQMQYRIAAVGEQVKTPAGAFGECLRVEGQAQLRIFFDAMGSWRDSPVSTREWYCRGVGLVRLERAEPSASKLLNGGTMTLELLTWH
jgi:hypothetical protein